MMKAGIKQAENEQKSADTNPRDLAEVRLLFQSLKYLLFPKENDDLKSLKGELLQPELLNFTSVATDLEDDS